MYIAIDIGGTNTRVANFPTLNTPSPAKTKTINTFEIYSDQFAAIQTCADELIGSDILEGIGISIGAQVAKDGQSVFLSSNLPDYEKRPLVADFRTAYGVEVRLAHDCVCGLLAEKMFGKLDLHDRCAYITLSTGTGGAVQLKQGAHVFTFSNEIGHQIIDPQGKTCLCGQVGCLETITGGKHIELFYGKPASQITDDGFWAEVTSALALGIVNLSWLTRIDAATISGGIALNNQYVKQNLQMAIDKLWVGGEGEIFPVFFSEMGDNAPLVGAMRLIATDPASILH